VTAKSGASFHSDNFGQGGTYEFTPKKAGTIKYTCTLHPGMDGTLTVTG
jgi:plastocyanin